MVLFLNSTHVVHFNRCQTIAPRNCRIPGFFCIAMSINNDCDISDVQMGIYIGLCDTTHMANGVSSQGVRIQTRKNNVDKEHAIQDLRYDLTWTSLQQAFSVLGIEHVNSCHLCLPVPSGRIKGLCVGYRSRGHGIGIVGPIYMGGLYMVSLIIEL